MRAGWLLKAVTLAATAIAVAGCQPSNSGVRGKQLDTLVINETGHGSQMTQPVALPHGRYTVFTYADPGSCLSDLRVLDSQSHVVADDGSSRQASQAPPPGAQVAPTDFFPSLVQVELQAASYRLAVATAGTSCSWMIQGILNSMLSDEAPPASVRLPSARDRTIASLTSSDPASDLHFVLVDSGIYEVSWRVSWPASAPPCPYAVDVIAQDGHANHLADGGSGPTGGGGSTASDGPRFLSAGAWRVQVATTCSWVLTVSPWVGSVGGGAEGFGAG